MADLPGSGPARPAGAAGADRAEHDTAHDRVWAALRSHAGSTPAEFSTAAGVARSTVAKLLTAWAADGSVTSTPAPPAAAPHRWTAAPSDLPPAPAPDPGGSAPADPHTGRNTDTSTGTRRRRGATTPTATTLQRGVPGAGRPRGGAAGTGTAPVNGAGRNQSGNPRLAAGALQGMVQDLLTEHPGDHGPTAIGRALGRSSGAVANALERLVTAGWAVRTNDRPRRYRTTDPTESPDATTTRGQARPEDAQTRSQPELSRSVRGWPGRHPATRALTAGRATPPLPWPVPERATGFPGVCDRGGQRSWPGAVRLIIPPDTLGATGEAPPRRRRSSPRRHDCPYDSARGCAVASTRRYLRGPVAFVDGEDLDAARATLLGAGATELSPRHARARGVRARGHRRQPDRAARRASPKFE